MHEHTPSVTHRFRTIAPHGRGRSYHRRRIPLLWPCVHCGVAFRSRNTSHSLRPSRAARLWSCRKQCSGNPSIDVHRVASSRTGGTLRNPSTSHGLGPLFCHKTCIGIAPICASRACRKSPLPCTRQCQRLAPVSPAQNRAAWDSLAAFGVLVLHAKSTFGNWSISLLLKASVSSVNVCRMGGGPNRHDLKIGPTSALRKANEC